MATTAQKNMGIQWDPASANVDVSLYLKTDFSFDVEKSEIEITTWANSVQKFTAGNQTGTINLMVQDDDDRTFYRGQWIPAFQSATGEVVLGFNFKDDTIAAGNQEFRVKMVVLKVTQKVTWGAVRGDSYSLRLNDVIYSSDGGGGGTWLNFFDGSAATVF